jgi:hypothetical protein
MSGDGILPQLRTCVLFQGIWHFLACPEFVAVLIMDPRHKHVGEMIISQTELQLPLTTGWEAGRVSDASEQNGEEQHRYPGQTPR